MSSSAEKKVKTDKDGKKRKRPVGADDGEDETLLNVETGQKLEEMYNWIVKQRRPLFDLLVFDEAHHIKAKTWDHISAQLRPAELTGTRMPNVLLLTATPFHASGNLDVPEVNLAYSPSSVASVL